MQKGMKNMERDVCQKNKVYKNNLENVERDLK